MPSILDVLAQIPTLPLDSIAVPADSHKALQDLKNMTSSDAIQTIVTALVNFAFKLAIAIFVFVLGKFIIKHLYKWVHKMVVHKGVDASLTTFILSLVRITLFFILIIIVVGILGIETSSFIALFASAGVAVGLALSGTLQNFAGGVLILLLKPYKVGDFIEAQGYSGTVKEIQIFNTIINTPDNKAIIIPNGSLSTSSINNFSLEEKRRIDWSVGIAYGTDFEKARKLIISILKSDERVYEDPAPEVFINELADSSVNLTVRAWCAGSDYWNLHFLMNELFYSRLPEHGIEFPFPQLDVHLTK